MMYSRALGWVLGGLSLAAAAPASRADVILFPSDLQLIGARSTSSGDLVQHSTASTLPYTGADSFTSIPDGFDTSALYDFFDGASPSSFHITFSLNRTGPEVGNKSEVFGKIFFKLTSDTQYDLSGQMSVGGTAPGHAQIFAAVFNPVGPFFVDDPSITAGMLSLSDSGLHGVLAAGTYEFRYDAFIEATAANTTASAGGSFDLHLNTTPAAAPETPLPSVASAGLALFGALSLHRSRRQRAHV